MTDDEINFRRPTAADHPRVVGVIDEWWGGRGMRHLLPRLWLEHFTGTSWIAEHPDGRLAGFAIAFISPDDPTIAYLHMIATDPNRRRRGLGQALVERAFADAAAHGARRITSITWPGNRPSIGFHRAMGFAIDDGPGTQPIFGTPAHPDHDGDGEDRVVFVRELTDLSQAPRGSTPG